MKIRNIAFHGTSIKNVNNMLSSYDNVIYASMGCYGSGIYCTNGIKKALKHSKDAIIGIELHGLEDKIKIPENKLKKWIIFDDNVPVNKIKYVVSFKENIQNLYSQELFEPFRILYIESPKLNPDSTCKDKIYFNQLSQIIYQDLQKTSKYELNLKKIKITEPYNIKKEKYSLEDLINKTI